MAKDFGDYDVDSMSDDDLRDLVVQLLEDEDTVDADAVEVTVRDGRVSIAGRLGTENEAEAVERILSDRVGLEDFTNELVIDELTRAEASEAADDAANEADRLSYDGNQRGDKTDPAAQHLTDDVEGDLYGTEDMQKAIEMGGGYTPPESPHEEGSRSRERH